jgi:hypothetical protein
MANCMIFLEKFRIAVCIGKPARAVLLGNAKSESDWMNLLSHGASSEYKATGISGS